MIQGVRLRPEIYPLYLASIFVALLEFAVCFAHTQTRSSFSFLFSFPSHPRPNWTSRRERRREEEEEEERREVREFHPLTSQEGGKRRGKWGKKTGGRKILCFEPFTGRITSVWSQLFSKYCCIIALFSSFSAFFFVINFVL